MSYSLSTSYAGESLLSGFNWFNGKDPSNGFVSYQSQDDAKAKGLWSVDDQTNVVRLGVDHTNKYGLNEGRPSIRLESKESYDHGLFIADFLHMPPSQCGLWPAFWTYGSDWPNGGELDIIEGANDMYRNVISGHTADGCVQDASATDKFSGEQRNTNCFIGEDNVGCGYNPPQTDVTSYGDAFNAVNGGVYAMQWNSEHIRVWHFPRGSIPEDIEAKKPQPDSWGLPQAVFGGPSCNVDSYWKNMSLVINTNFCGDYGNALWGDTCGGYAPTCSEYVANNPDAFINAYWDVNYIDAYQLNPNGPNDSGSPFVTSQHGDQTPKPANPEKIEDFAYLGCFGSKSDFKTFDMVEEDEGMTPEMCVDMCKQDKSTYAGTFEKKCYCADDLDADTQAKAKEYTCDKTCPGDDSKFCGGDSSDASLGPFLLTVYHAVADEEAPPPPPMATGGLIPAPTVMQDANPTFANKFAQQAPPATTLTVTICPQDAPAFTRVAVISNGTMVRNQTSKPTTTTTLMPVTAGASGKYEALTGSVAVVVAALALMAVL